MKTIYLMLNEENRLTGFSYNQPRSGDGNKVEVEEDHEVLKNPRIYKYDNGSLVRDNEYQLQNVKQAKIEELRAACQNDILQYFEATVNEVAYLFSYDNEAQNNFSDTASLFTNGLITNVEWTVHQNGEIKRIVLNKDQFMSVLQTAYDHKNSKIKRLRDDLQALVENATTIEEVQNITW